MERAWLKWIFALVLAALFVLDVWFAVTGRVLIFDERILGFFYTIRNDSLTAVFRAITFIGNPSTVIVISIALIILPGRMKTGLPVALMTTAGWGAQTLIKTLVARPRPDPAYWLIELSSNEYYQSFPSGHSNASMILWLALAILIGRVLISRNKCTAAVFLRIVFAVIAVSIGISRLYLGVHYPSDVIAGWLLAGLILIICFSLYDRFWPSKWRVSNNLCPSSLLPRNNSI